MEPLCYSNVLFKGVGVIYCTGCNQTMTGTMRSLWSCTICLASLSIFFFAKDGGAIHIARVAITVSVTNAGAIMRY